MNLLTLCQTAMDEIGFSRPSIVASSTDTDARQLLALANREGTFLAERKAFSKLVKEYTFVLVAAQQDYDLPSDFNWLIPDTLWNRDDRRAAIGPMDSGEWQYLKGWNFVNGLNMRFRIYNGKLRFDQTITSDDAGKTLAFEYVSTHWVLAADGTTTKEKCTLDTDTFVLDDELMIMGLKWRFKKAKGFDWQEDYAEYKAHSDLLLARDGGQRRIQLAGSRLPEFGVNTPEGSVGL